MKPMEFEKQKDLTLNKARYSKKAKKNNPRAKHAHEYIEVLILIKQRDFSESNIVHERACRMFICAHCGKIKNIVSMEQVPGERGLRYYTSLSREEMFERYPKLLRFSLEDKVYRSPYEVEENKFLDIRQMYRDQVEILLPLGYEMMVEDVTNGLLQSTNPVTMATSIMKRKPSISELILAADEY